MSCWSLNFADESAAFASSVCRYSNFSRHIAIAGESLLEGGAGASGFFVSLPLSTAKSSSTTAFAGCTASFGSGAVMGLELLSDMIINLQMDSVSAIIDYQPCDIQCAGDSLAKASFPNRSNTTNHPESGNITFDDWLNVYESRVPEHIQFMQENYEA